ncbi:PIN domain-containing protein [Nostoc sp. NMS4]|uniref:type II toxin-antitoxin system VapC family toxin n=1 Tax=Nostoc sp. NMS4 TaxID=2815390 RepID=UPI0025D37603|nr:PIN domain-containing protein [Nostoc sp. NMS4]MBN3923955.1 PIN domain-containing protein [Nostoc sp. NMS4]
MGQLILPTSGSIYIDTSVAIYTIEGNPDYYSLLQPLWSKLYAGEIQIISSEIILMEVLVVPLRNGNNSLVADYEELLLSQVQLIPISQSILRKSANLRATTNLKTPDAIHAATALSVNSNQFITNNKGFRNVPGFPVVILSEVLAF